MMARKRSFLVAGALLLAGCGGLPRPLRQEIASENEKLKQADRQLNRSMKTIGDDLAHAPDLFQGTSAAADWHARIRSAQSKLDSAKSDSRELEKMQGSGGKEAVTRAERILSDERHLRDAALDEARAVESEATHWLDFRSNLPHYLAKMQTEYDAVRAVDFMLVTNAVQKAEQDWPAKKADLDNRLAALKSEQSKAEEEWSSTEAARHSAASQPSGPVVATLVQADDGLARDSVSLPRDTGQLTSLCGELYNAWDKVLDDLEISNNGPDKVYREKVKTVTTHFVDVAAKQSEISSDVQWVDVSPGAWHAVEGDLGMAISHKDAGLYDSEASNIAQPAGFAYIAPPSVGSNQYGYWTHNDHGSFWTFLPQYLIMRELLWGHSYRPIVINEYNGYYNAQRSGRTWYGQETPAAPPKYGSHGTFTEQRYAGSRYVQSGGFKGSAYASRSSPSVAPPPSQRFGNAEPDNGPGKRFGHGADAEPQGKRFGSGGSRPSSPPPSGRRFGSGGSPRPSVPRSFGRRR
ncbi:MAG: hypothetical protein ABSB15_01545 [Bryobacteraceae bacterium]|jgi:hypothetical protein